MASRGHNGHAHNRLLESNDLMKRMTFDEDFSEKSSRSTLSAFPIDFGIDRRMKWPSPVPRGGGGEQEIGIGNVDGESRGAK